MIRPGECPGVSAQVGIASELLYETGIKRTVFLVPVLQPVNGVAGEQVGYIGLLIIINAFTVDVQGGAVVNTLTPKTFPVVKPGLRLVRMTAHVPLAKKLVW